MRYILWLCMVVSLCNFVSAQEISDIRVNYTQKDARLQDIFHALETEYGIRFSYATAAIEDKVMDVDFADASLPSVLDYLLIDEALEYKIISNNVLLRKASTYAVEKNEAYNSSLHIKGRVTNTTAEALDYATISVSNSTIGTFADEAGNFDLEIPKAYQDETIVVHYLGYQDEVNIIS